MKLHSSVVEQLIRLYATYGGHREELKLKNELSKVDLSVYEQQTGEKQLVLVLTEELQRRSQG